MSNLSYETAYQALAWDQTWHKSHANLLRMLIFEYIIAWCVANSSLLSFLIIIMNPCLAYLLMLTLLANIVWWYLAYMPIFISLPTVIANMHESIVSIAGSDYVYANYHNIVNVICIIHYGNILIGDKIGNVLCQILPIS